MRTAGPSSGLQPTRTVRFSKPKDASQTTESAPSSPSSVADRDSFSESRCSQSLRRRAHQSFSPSPISGSTSNPVRTGFDVDPEIGDGLKDWCALRLKLWEHLDSEKLSRSATDDGDDGADSVVWDASLGFEKRTVRVGCSPLEGPAVLIYPAARAHAGTDPAATGTLQFSHVLMIEAPNPQSPDKPFRYELQTRAFSASKPALTVFGLAYT